MLEKGSRLTFGAGGREPELVTLKGNGARPHAVAVFPMDCEGVDLPLLQANGPNSSGVHEVCWLSRNHPDLRDRQLTRWPLLRVMCDLRRRTARAKSIDVGS